MRILRARVPEFGPLRSLEVAFDPGLNLVWGANEAGKTTLLDFLLGHLFRKEGREGRRLSTVMGDVDRFGSVEEVPGEVLLRVGDRSWSYPEEGPSLLRHLRLEHAGLAGLFCVRSGELELPESREGEFWRAIKKVLSGLPEGLESLANRARAEGGLTATGQLSDQGSPGLKTERAELEERIDSLETLAAGLDEVADLAGRITDAERRLEALERAREARVARLYRNLVDARSKLEELPELSAESVEAWDEAASERKRLEAELEGKRKALEEAERSAREAKRAVEELEGRHAPLRERLDGARQGAIEERARGFAALDRPLAAPLRGGLYWGGLVLLLAAIGAAFFVPSDTLGRPGWLLGIASGLLAGGALYWLGRRERRRAANRAAERDLLLEEAADVGLDAERIGALPAAVDALEDRVHELERELEGARERRRSSEERRKEREEAVRSREAALREAEEAIRRAREALGLESLERARALLEERHELRERADNLRTALQELAGMDESVWARAEERGDDEELPEWNPRSRRDAEQRLETLREEHAERSRAFTRVGLDRPEDVLTELEAARRRVAAIELDREAGSLAGEIFASMGEALDERLARTIAREGPHSVGSLVERVTDRYRALERRDDGGLVVEDREGRRRPLARLSRGTRDQVFLALRVGLARSALEAADLGEPGFFLLDDAFLTADWDRRERLVEASAGLAEEGWQVIYLTCDDHLRELFEGAGARVHKL